MSSVERLISRLRELALASPSALVSGAPTELRRELLDAFAEDVVTALREAEEHASQLIATLSDGPGPWAFAGASPKARRGAASERRESWSAGFRDGAEAAQELSRLLSAAAPLVDVLAAADAATVG